MQITILNCNATERANGRAMAENGTKFRGTNKTEDNSIRMEMIIIYFFGFEINCDVCFSIRKLQKWPVHRRIMIMREMRLLSINDLDLS